MNTGFDITPYLKLMVEKGASDIFFTANSHVNIKIEGVHNSVGKTVLTGDLTKAAAYGVMNELQIKRFEEAMECDFAIYLGDIARFRVNVFRQRGEVSMVLRYIPNKIPKIGELGMPEILGELVMHKRGLILMVGTTGSGKSTTLAAMINHRNQNKTGHILTIEDPVEFSHTDIKSIVSQREVGVDTMSYAAALRSSLRESPDVILIGEIRDRETMEAALELSITGHLTISTMHAVNTNQAIERVIKLFPQDMHPQLLMELSLNLNAVISQRLVMTVDSNRCAAAEIMINTPYISELIRNGEINKVNDAMVDSNRVGMQTFDMALYDLFKEGRIEMEEALSNADSRTNLENRINFG